MRNLAIVTPSTLMISLISFLSLGSATNSFPQDSDQPQLIIETGHSATVCSLAFSPDGKILASGGLDGIARLWDIATRKELRALPTSGIVAFSPDAKTIAIANQDFTIKLFNILAGKIVLTLTGHSSPITSLAFNPSGKTLASASSDGTIKLWNVIEGKLLFTTGAKPSRLGLRSDIRSIAFSPDGNTLASVGSADGVIRLWNSVTGQQVITLPSEAGSPSSVAFSPDGKTIAGGGENTTVNVWEVKTGRRLHVMGGHSGPVTSVAYSPDGHILVSGSLDKTIKVWDAANNKELRTLVGHSAEVWSLAFSPDGSILASGSLDRTIKFWTVSRQPKPPLHSDFDLITPVAFSPDNKTLASGGSSLKLWDVTRGKELRILEGHSKMVLSVAFSPDGKTLASGGDDHTTRLWDIQSGKEMETLVAGSGVHSVAFSPDGSMLASGTGDGTISIWVIATDRLRRIQSGSESYSVAFSPDSKTLVSTWEDSIKLWEAPSVKEVRALAGDSDGVTSLAFSPDGRTIVGGTDSGAVKTWELRGGTVQRTLTKHGDSVTSVAISRDGKTVASAGRDGVVKLSGLTEEGVRTLSGHSGFVTSVAFSADGKMLAGGNHDGAITLWDVSGEELRVLGRHADSLPTTAFSGDSKNAGADTGGEELASLSGRSTDIRPVVFSPDGKTLAVGAWDVKLWDVTNTGKPLTLGGYSDSVWSVAFSPDSNTLASGSLDGTIKIWNLATGQELHTLPEDRSGYGPPIRSVAFSSDGRTLASGDHNGTIKLWNVTTGQELRSWKAHNDEIRSVSFSPDGKLIATGSRSWSIKLWNAADGQQLRVFSPDYFVTSSIYRTEDLVSLLTFSADGKVLAGIGRDNTIRLWELASGRELRSLPGHWDLFLSVAFNSDGTLASSTQDGFIKLWDVGTGKEIRTWSAHSFAASSISFSPDGRTLASGSRDGTVKLWNTSGEELATLVSLEQGNWVVSSVDGRFDSGNLEEVRGVHWIMPDDPLKALPLEIFTRDYYEPRLLPRALKGGKLSGLPSLRELNRIQPRVEKISVVPHKDNPEFVDVNVKVSSVAGQCLRNDKPVECESGVYDLRLYRDGQLVEESPSPADSPITNSSGRDWRDQLQRWRETSLVRTGDGRPIATALGASQITFTNIRLRKRSDVLIPQVEFTAYAFNEDRVKSETSKTTVYPLPSANPLAKRRAFVVTVGVDATSDPSLRLAFAPKGAREIERQLKEKLQFDYEVVTFPLISEYKEDGTELAQYLATKSNLRAALNVLSGRETTSSERRSLPNQEQLRAATPDDLLVLYIASHGYADPSGKFYVIPSDIGEPAGVSEQLLDRCLKNAEQSSSCESAREFLRQSISSDELTQWLQMVDAGEMVLILDSCHSAAVSGSGFRPGPMGDRGFGQLSYDKGMLVLAATQAENVDWGTLELGDRSLLTYALTQKQMAGQTFDLRQWLSAAQKQVPELYQRFVKAERSSSSESRLDQEPALFDFSKKR